MAERLFSAYQVADLLGATPTTVVEWIQKGWLPAHRMGDGPMRVSEKGLIQFLKNRGVDLEMLVAKTALAEKPNTNAAVAATATETSAPATDKPSPAGKPDAPAGPTNEEAAPPPPSHQIADTRPQAPLSPQPPAVKQQAQERRLLFGAARRSSPISPPQPAAPPPAEHRAATPPQAAPAPAAAPPASAEDAPRQAPPPKPQPPREQPPHEQPESPARPDEPAAQIAAAILADAAARGASAIHLDSTAGGLTLSLRLGGRLREKPSFSQRLPRGAAGALVGHFLSLAGQAADNPIAAGTFTKTISGRELEFSLQSLPTPHGPCLRIKLAPAAADLSQLPLGDAGEHAMRSLLSNRSGLILICTPAAGDAAPLLRAAAGELHAAGRSVVAVGSGASGRLAGATECPAGPGRPAYASAMAAAGNADADAVLLEDIRDPRTAGAALEAALSGSLVVAGVRAAGAAAGIETLLRMGLEPWPLAAGLRAAVEFVQLRRLCPECKREGAGEAEMPAGLSDGKPSNVHSPRGCRRCGMTGYDDAFAMCAIWPARGALAAAIRAWADCQAIAQAAVADGFKNARDLALEAVRSGKTSIEEFAAIFGQAW